MQVLESQKCLGSLPSGGNILDFFSSLSIESKVNYGKIRMDQTTLIPIVSNETSVLNKI